MDLPTKILFTIIFNISRKVLSSVLVFRNVIEKFIHKWQTRNLKAVKNFITNLAETFRFLLIGRGFNPRPNYRTY
jgi:integral membrane sensor domain MASE1